VGPHPQVARESGSWGAFVGDFRWGIRTWRSAPWFVVLVGAMWAASVAVDRSASFLSLPFALVLAGFYGTQWLFYLRLLTNRDLRPVEIPWITIRCIGRFLRLGLLTLGPLIVALLVAVMRQGASNVSHAGRVRFTNHAQIFVILYELVIDALLTFVTPSLVYSTSSAVESIRLGLKRLRATWPASAWYVLTPGLTLSLSAYLIPRSALGVGGAIGIAVAGGLLGFAFKGAIAPFFFRSLSNLDVRAGGADP